MTQIFSLQQFKGGEGKSTIAVNLAAACARAGLFTVLVEMDGQSSATVMVGNEPNDGLYDLVIAGAPLGDVLKPVSSVFTGIDDDLLYMISAYGRTVDVVTNPNTPTLLYRALNGLRNPEYGVDVVIIDTSPTSTPIHAGCIYASDFIIIPTSLEMASLTSLKDTLQYVRNANDAAPNIKSAEVFGIVPNNVDMRTKPHQLGLYSLEAFYGQYKRFPQIRALDAFQMSQFQKQSLYTYVVSKGLNRFERGRAQEAIKSFEPLANAVIAKVMEQKAAVA